MSCLFFSEIVMDMRRIESARGPVMISCFVFIGSRELNGDISVPCSRLYYVFYLNRLRIMSRISPAPRPLGRKAVQRYNHFSEPTKFFSNFFSKKIADTCHTLLYIKHRPILLYYILIEQSLKVRLFLTARKILGRKRLQR